MIGSAVRWILGKFIYQLFMNKKRQTTNRAFLRRDQSSSFVVDLRQPVAEVWSKKTSQKDKRLKISIPKRSKVKTSFKFWPGKRNKRSSSWLKIGPTKRSGLKFKWPKSLFKKKTKQSKNRWLKIYQKRLSRWSPILENSAKRLKSKRKRQAQEERGLSRLKSKLLVYRSLLGFISILILIILPLKALSGWQVLSFRELESNISEKIQGAFSSLKAAEQEISLADFQQAGQDFSLATDYLAQAQTELESVSQVILTLASLSNNPKLRLASESKKLLAAGITATALAKDISLATDAWLSPSVAEQNLSTRLTNFSSLAQEALIKAEQLSLELAKIKLKNLPTEHQVKFIELKEQLVFFSNNFKALLSSVENIQTILGRDTDQRYLLIFQNNAEIRASGGFIGSYALLDLKQGEIKNLEVPGGGAYDLEGGLQVQVVAPEPLWVINPRWYFWDANWWPDWPKTAQHLQWFYEKSGGPTVDGVISFTPQVVIDLLTITGPIDLPEYDLKITSDNFQMMLQLMVERDNIVAEFPELVSNLTNYQEAIESSIPLEQDLEQNTDNKPKKIIGDLMVRILEVLPEKINQDSWPKILSLLQQELSSKQILFYFSNQDLQSEASRYNLSGEIKETPGDYLAVIHTNIAGQKTDQVIVEDLELSSDIAPSGEIINTLKITRTHQGLKGEPFTGAQNNDWLRVYVPLGSQLISATGFNAPAEEFLQKKPESHWEQLAELAKEREATRDALSQTLTYEDSGKTVFANWVLLKPGETAEIILKYQLPINIWEQVAPQGESLAYLSKLFKLSETRYRHSLLLQKQAGAKPSSFSAQINFPKDRKVLWSYPEATQTSQWKIETILNQDEYWSALIY